MDTTSTQTGMKNYLDPKDFIQINSLSTFSNPTIPSTRFSATSGTPSFETCDFYTLQQPKQKR